MNEIVKRDAERGTTDRGERLYSRAQAMEIARISGEVLRWCERERVVQLRAIRGETGYSAGDIRRMARVQRLHEDLGLDLPAVEVVLHMRRRVLDLLAELEEIERGMISREAQLLSEIHHLRRQIAEDVDWRR